MKIALLILIVTWHCLSLQAQRYGDELDVEEIDTVAASPAVYGMMMPTSLLEENQQSLKDENLTPLLRDKRSKKKVVIINQYYGTPPGYGGGYSPYHGNPYGHYGGGGGGHGGGYRDTFKKLKKFG